MHSHTPDRLLNLSHKNGSVKALTSIREGIHCATTNDAPEDENSETDMIIIRNFLNTLAEVALAVAARQGSGVDDRD